MPTVSVIIPTHKRKAYLQEAINSVLAQTYSDYEVIVVENGCVPEAEGLVAGLDDPRIRYAYSPEPNRSLARNLGVQVSHGQYLAFLDDDDRFLPTYLDRQVSFLEANPSIGLVGCGAFLIDEMGQRFGEWRLWELSPKLDLVSCFPDCYLTPTMSVMQRFWYEKERGQDPSLPPAEDTDLALRLMVAGCEMEWQRELLYEYRVHQGSSQRAAARYAIARDRIVERILSDPRTPNSLTGKADSFRLGSALTAVGQCYVAGDVTAGRHYLRKCLHLGLGVGANKGVRRIMEQVLGASGRWEIGDPYETARRAVDLLSKDVTVPRTVRRRALAEAAQADFYRGWQRGGGSRRVVRDFATAAIHQPSWLLNIGTWSILLRSIWMSLVKPVHSWCRSGLRKR